MPKIIDSWANLCNDAKNYGATIGFEIMGCAMIDNIPEAINMVKSAGAKNGGIILDIYQISNLGITFDEIRSIPLEYLICVELNDGILPGNPEHDPSNRRFCGDGEYDIQGFISCLNAMGYKGPWAVEVISEELSKLPLHEISRKAYDTTIAEFIVSHSG